MVEMEDRTTCRPTPVAGAKAWAAAAAKVEVGRARTAAGGRDLERTRQSYTRLHRSCEPRGNGMAAAIDGGGSHMVPEARFSACQRYNLLDVAIWPR